jgi:hypothetical protein
VGGFLSRAELSHSAVKYSLFNCDENLKEQVQKYLTGFVLKDLKYFRVRYVFTESFENDTAILSLLPSSNNGEM